MTHIDDHTLELYVLGAESVAGRKPEIEAHLDSCPACLSYTQMVREFYAEVDRKLAAHETPGELPALSAAVRSIARRDPEELIPFYNEGSALPDRSATRLQKLRSFTRRHPVVTGSGAFAILAGLAMLTGNIVTVNKDSNPAYHRNNVKEGLVEIRNAEGERLWSLPADEIDAAEGTEHDRHVYSTVLADIDGNGKNEVLTTASREAERKNRTSPLRVFDGTGKLLFAVQFTKPVHYLTRDYPETWRANAILTIAASEAGTKDILVKWGCTRSPTVLTRVDSKGHIVGEFWHFGHFTAMYLTGSADEARQRLLVMGINDTKDSVAGEFPFLAILNPDKITGAGKSSVAEGFRLPVSQAEEYYIAMPKSLLSSVLGGNEMVKNLERDLSDALTLTVEADFPEGTAAWEYVFNRDMSLRTVKSSSVSGALYQRLQATGQLKGTTMQTILDQLKEGVRYWDGREWRKEPTSLNHQWSSIK